MNAHPGLAKRYARLGDVRLAYIDEGKGTPILLLHGCPFASFVWDKVIRLLAPMYRCLAPDLLGLGDTETPDRADWLLPAQARTIVEFLDVLGIEKIHVVGHDHGGAVAQLLAANHPARVDRLVLANVEAYDNWPSSEERPFVTATQIPLLGNIVLWLWSRRPILRATLVRAKAVYDPSALTREFVDALIDANLRDRRRRARTRRFLALQFDPRNNRVTNELVADLRRFDHGTLLIWGKDDPHFGPEWGDRLQEDIPRTPQPVLLESTGHLLMEERPQRVADLIRDFLV